ncbi:ABC transporter permease [Mesobacterium pallidum]|uniref:ABC transporter permease n=1 Tax=Mesobacterium pallidum TaxID=2872037 RepID=UPI001EE271E2|nr:ABC transporter permease [Mesobacterium pallidum]
MVSPLDRKLVRDLWRMKGQAGAIALVMAVGVMIQVMMPGLVASLTETRAAYYDRSRFAEVFAPVTRAPEAVLDRLAAIPGVASVEGRITGHAQLTLPGQALALRARALSIPADGAPRLNAILLSEGTMFDPSHPDEVVLLDSFAAAHGLRPGDTLDATINGTRRTLRITGLGQSPEFLYVTAPGEFVPDDARYGVLWMSRRAMAAGFDQRGTFNEALLGLTRDARLPAVLDAVDRLLDPYGGAGAYGREDQLSHAMVTQEIDGLKVSSRAIPPIFLGVAAFLLYIVVSRMVQAEREEIGLLKAFGYTDAEVGWHYVKLALVISLAGAVLGCALGILAGRGMVQMYLQFFKFPFLVFRVDPASFVLGVGASVLAAGAGGLFVLRQVFALTPAEAMRPPAPADYSGAGRMRGLAARLLDQPSRMVLRRITRQPWRMAGTVTGIACGMGLTAAMMTIYDSFDATLETSFAVMDRSDMAVSFTHPLGTRVLYDLARIDGVGAVEPTRSVPVVLRHGLRTHKGAITGLVDGARLGRAVDARGLDIPLPDHGLVLSTALADKLQLRPGENLTVEVREGRRPVLTLPVTAVADSLMGAPAYMEIGALNRALREPGRASGAYLVADAADTAAIGAALRDMPDVAGTSVKADSRAAFERLMNEGAGTMRYVMGAVAFVITFGIVYNAARVAQAERARDLGSLRILGFHTGETAFVLLGELAVITLLAIPAGSLLALGLTKAIAAGFSTELYQIPSTISPAAHGQAALAVLAAALLSGWVVRRDLGRMDLISTLKIRE